MEPWTVLLVSHVAAASVCLPLGLYQLLRRPRGDRRHRQVGRAWAALMLWTAFSSFAIREIRDGSFSVLHALSVVTIVSVALGVSSARRGRIQAHRGQMTGAWLGLVGAFLGAVAVPDRRLPQLVVHDLPTALGALALIVAAAVGVVAAAAVLERLTASRLVAATPR